METTSLIRPVSKLLLGSYGIYIGMNGNPFLGFIFLALAIFY